MKYNLLFVLTDQFRAACLEDDPVDTPHLDAFSKEAIRVQQAVSSYPVCSPHRAMLITGMHPSRNGVTMNLNSANCLRGTRLRDDVTSWGQSLADNGYETTWIGKWHLEEPKLPEDEIYGEGRRDDGKVWDAWSPPNRRFGFKHWHSYGCCDQHLKPHYWQTDTPWSNPLQIDQWSAEYETTEAIERLSAVGDDPFAMVVSWNPPHQPFDQLPPWYNRQYRERDAADLLVRPNVPWGESAVDEAVRFAPDYYAQVEAIDTQFGRLMEALEQNGLADNTIVVFTSDHGQQMGSQGLLYKNVPFEESMRLPCLIRVPGQGSGETSAMLSSVDIAPTLLGLLDVEVPAEMQGRDLSKVILGEQPVDPDEASLYYFWGPDTDLKTMRGIRTHEWKYVAVREADGEMSHFGYQLSVDPYEQNPITDPQVLEPLMERLLAELEKAGEKWEGTQWIQQQLQTINP